MRFPAHIVLEGPRAVGKTTIGAALAARWQCPFIDLDDRVLAGFSEPTVTEVWQQHGEPAWRAAEVRALEAALEEPPSVVALGGGVPAIDEAALQLQEGRGRNTLRVVRLVASLGELARRLTQAAGDRPSLRGGDVASESTTVCQERESAYAAVADITIDVEGRSMDILISEIEVAVATSMGVS